MNRRFFLTTALATATAGAALTTRAIAHKGDDHPYQLTDAEWRAKLTDAEYRVMRQEGTERAGSSPLDKNYAAGTYHCKGCDQAVYPSDTKYDSTTGWPSFWNPVSQSAIGTKPDRKLIYLRTEVHCSNCGSHLGHIFDDGPAPTGKRHCLNGIALNFRAA